MIIYEFGDGFSQNNCGRHVDLDIGRIAIIWHDDLTQTGENTIETR